MKTMNYGDKFYSKYISTHTSQLYGEINLDNIKKQFPVWQKYFGKFLPQDKNAKIVDLGCGNGGFVYWLQQLGYSNTEGIDISSEQIEAAEKLGIKNIFQADIETFLQNKKESYDLIFARDIIEHFSKEKITDILDFVFQSLKDGGIFICQTVNAGNILWGRLRHGDFTHEIAFTDKSMYQILAVSGFKDIEVFPMPPVIHGFKSLFRSILWNIIEWKLRFYLLIETGSAKGIFTQDLIAVAKKTTLRQTQSHGGSN